MTLSPETLEKLAHFNRVFKIVPTSLFNVPRSKAGDTKPGGDCQDYGKSIKDILDVSFPKAIMVRCYSKENLKFPFLPRHAVLWVKGLGFIDSTRREFRKTPWPHLPVWPVGAPLIGGIVWSVGFWNGWWGAPDWLINLAAGGLTWPLG